MTIGDGIVTQVPALIIAVGTGIIVTRSASDGNLSQEVLRQITSLPKALWLVITALMGLALLPGIPVIPTLGLIALLAVATWWVGRMRGVPLADESGDGAGSAEVASDVDHSEERSLQSYAWLKVDPIEVHVGLHWSELIKQPEHAFTERLAAFRRQYALELGLMLPPVRIKDSTQLGAYRYEIHLDGVMCGKGEARGDRLLAIHPTGKSEGLVGEPTRDPTYGLPALWIDPIQREAAKAANFTVVDSITVFMTHLTEILRRESANLLTRAETDRLLEQVRQQQGDLVEELIPALLSVGDVQRVLQSLLREKVSIRHVQAILETLVSSARQSKDVAYLTELVRLRLGHAICQALVGESDVLHVLTLDPRVESELLQNVQSAQVRLEGGAINASGFAVLEPRLVEQITVRLMQQAERMMKSNLLPVLICAPDLRRHLRAMSERVLPHLRVLSMAEIPNSIELKAFATVAV